MPIVKSTPEELRQARRLVKAKKLKIRRLVAAGKKVHIIWDVDHVLVSGRSDDMFGLLGFDVKKYFAYEERLITEQLENGIWAGLAHCCGDPGWHQSQDIVTARSSLVALRLTLFLFRNKGGIPMRWQLFVGHQPKTESYRIILKSFEKDPDTHVVCIDDAAKHVAAFETVAAELGMADRCHGIVAPQVREYDEAELLRELDGVMNLRSDKPYLFEVRRGAPGEYHRIVQVTPDPSETLRSMFWRETNDVHVRATVDQNRKMLEEWAEQVWPGQKQTDQTLYNMLELLREPR